MRIIYSSLFAAALLIGIAHSAQAKVRIEIDKSAQQMEVYVDGEHRHSWPVSTGRSGRDTPSGSFKAFRMERDHYSKEWDDAPMPHSIFFTKTGHAIHGSLETKKIGSPASAGCIRLAPENAEKLFALVEEKGVLNTSVVVTGDLQVALARARQRTATREGNGARSRRRAEPLPIDPDTYVERRWRNEGVGVYPSPDVQEGELDAYAQRMRRRYYQERARVYVPPQYQERRYYGQRTYEQPYYEVRPYAPRGYYFYD